MNTTNGFKFPTVKTVNGKPVGEDCVTCGFPMQRGKWLCSECSTAIGYKNINHTINNMPNYLHNSQYEKWLKTKLSEYLK